MNEKLMTYNDDNSQISNTIKLNARSHKVIKIEICIKKRKLFFIETFVKKCLQSLVISNAH
jgi:hypothetical protein